MEKIIKKGAFRQNGLKIVHRSYDIFEKFKSHENQIAVIGLGYVGLPLAMRLNKYFGVIGYDLSKTKVNSIQNYIDPNGELSIEEMSRSVLKVSDNEAVLKNAQFFIATVPTPVDANKKIDLTMIQGACELIGRYLKKGDVVVFESTVYPGCTEEFCLPILSQVSGLNPSEFGVAFSPERINPGKNGKRVEEINKIVSANNERTLKLVTNIYQTILKADVYQAKSIRVAESAKLLENIQRDVNIALINEFSRVMHRIGVSSHDVIDAAMTKWNFANYRPGLVGGHCISVDPYYLIDKASTLNIKTPFISNARRVNENMLIYFEKIIEEQLKHTNSTVLIQGLSFKSNVSDLRNSKYLELARRLNHKDGITLLVEEPNIKDPSFAGEFKVYNENCKEKIDLVFRASDHDFFKESKSINCLISNLSLDAVFIDLPGNNQVFMNHSKYIRI